jgi:hypothetical protein
VRDKTLFAVRMGHSRALKGWGRVEGALIHIKQALDVARNFKGSGRSYCRALERWEQLRTAIDKAQTRALL